MPRPVLEGRQTPELDRVMLLPQGTDEDRMRRVASILKVRWTVGSAEAASA